MQTPDPPLLNTPAEAGAKLRVGDTKIKELIRSGELESVLIGRSRRIPADALEAFVARLRGSATGASA